MSFTSSSFTEKSPTRIHTFFGMSWNPFVSSTPLEGLVVPEESTRFFRQVEFLIQEGGFALVQGEPGAGKSVTLRLLDHHLQNRPDITVRVISRPQSRVVDFYRELGNLFSLTVKSHNRYDGFKGLRQQWLDQIKKTG